MKIYITRFSPSRNDLIFERLLSIGWKEDIIIIHGYGDYDNNKKSDYTCLKLLDQSKYRFYKVYNYVKFNLFVIYILLKNRSKIDGVMWLDLINVPLTWFFVRKRGVKLILDSHELFSQVYKKTFWFFGAYLIETLFLHKFNVILIPSRLRKLYILKVNNRIEERNILFVENITTSKKFMISRLKKEKIFSKTAIYQGSVNNQNYSSLVILIDTVISMDFKVDLQVFGPLSVQLIEKFRHKCKIIPVDNSNAAMEILSKYEAVLIAYNKGNINNELCAPRKLLEAMEFEKKIFTNDLLTFRFYQLSYKKIFIL